MLTFKLKVNNLEQNVIGRVFSYMIVFTDYVAVIIAARISTFWTHKLF